MPRQWEPTNVRKKQIVDAAYSLMAERGIKELSVENIAKIVCVSPSTIYRHFKSLDDVVEGVLQHLSFSMNSYFESAGQQGATPTDCLYIFFQQLLNNVFTKKVLPEIMLTPEFFDRAEQHRQILLGLFNSVQVWVQRQVEKGQADGTISQSVVADKFWILLLGTVRAFIILRELSGDNLKPDQHCAEMWQMLAKVLDPR